VSVKLDTSVLDRMIAEHEREASQIVRAGAFAIEGHAKDKAPVDTGALKNSIEAEERSGPLAWWVHDGVEYGIYQELGTSRMAAQPFLTPAVEGVRKRWNDMWKDFFRKWK
jgi:HK97 gp10 family phage protein